MTNRYPDRVPMEERPEFSLENIPENIVQHALGIAVNYGACPECGERQFYNTIPGHNSEHDCKACDFTMTIVG